MYLDAYLERYAYNNVFLAKLRPVSFNGVQSSVQGTGISNKNIVF